MARTMEDVGITGDSAGMFLSGAQKTEVWENAYPFVITDAEPNRPGSGDYPQAQTVFTIRFSATKTKSPGWSQNTENSEWLLAITANSFREAMATKLLKALALDPDPIGPCYLQQYVIDPKKYANGKPNGSWSWDVKGEADDAAKRKGVTPSSTNPDDDIPF